MARRKKSLVAPILALAITGVVGLLLVSMMNSKPSKAIIKEKIKTIIKEAPTIKILTAKDNITVGTKITAKHFVWRSWPEGLLSTDYITKNDKPETINSLHGGIVRVPMVKGEPVIATKIVSPGERGAMAILLRKGMRAISVPISAISGAGGFILPGDRVDVLYTSRIIQRNLFKSEINLHHTTNISAQQPVLKNYINLKKRQLVKDDDKKTSTLKEQSNKISEKELLVANDTQFTELMIENVRILAIDQSYSQGQPGATSNRGGNNGGNNNVPTILGASATLEVTPEQAKLLAWSVASGKLTLSLRALDVSESINDETMPITKTSFAWPLEDILSKKDNIVDDEVLNNKKLRILRSNHTSSIRPQKSPNSRGEADVIR